MLSACIPGLFLSTQTMSHRATHPNIKTKINVVRKCVFIFGYKTKRIVKMGLKLTLWKIGQIELVTTTINALLSSLSNERSSLVLDKRISH